jgi:hypothetical protein
MGSAFHRPVTDNQGVMDLRPVLALGLVLLLGACGSGDTPDAGPPGSGFCEPPLSVCGSECVSTDNDPNHCGRCNQACPSGTFCDLGRCAALCQEGTVECGASCADLMTDRRHCGACDRPCSGDRMCVGGQCACPSGTTNCDGACVDLLSSRANCGACNRACDSDEVCNQGDCTCAAGARESSCNDGVDDDCDEFVDCADPDCNGSTRPCNGVCGVGIETCQAAGTWGACSGGDGSGEVCGDGIDQDCDGNDQRMPDGYEPNDTCGACTLLPGTDLDVTISASFDSVDDPVDCFKFNADDSNSYQEVIFLQLTEIPANNDYDLYLYANEADCNARVPLASSTALGALPEQLEWGEAFGASDSGTYYIRVVRFAGQSCTQGYRLLIRGLD